MNKTKKPTQKEQVIEYVKRHGSITPLQAIYELNIMRLAAIVYTLKGTPDELVQTKNPKQETYATYCLKRALSHSQ